MSGRIQKILAALTALILLLGCVPVMADTDAYALCAHRWTMGETVLEPTCEETGIALKVCLLCDSISSDYYTLSRVNHDYSFPAQIIREADCTNSGLVSYACVYCSRPEGFNRYVAAYGHDFGEPFWTEPGCTENARYIQVCSRCSYEKLHWQKADSALGHDIRETIVKEASCSEEGLIEIKCSRCNELPAVQRTIPRLAHDYQSMNTKASCTEDGVVGIVCTVCGSGLGKVERTPATGHMLMVLPPVAPTCTESGLSVGEYCEYCKEIFQPQTVVPSAGHMLMVLPPVEPSCTESGLSVGEYCQNCKEIFQPQAIIPAKGHSAVILPGRDASCSEEGLTEGSSCGVCGVVLKKQQAIPAAEHAWELSKNGKKYVCEACGEEMSAKPSAVSIDAPLTTMELNVGDTLTLDVIYSPRNSYSPLSWTSSNKKVVAIDENGELEALTEGSATITVKTANSRKDTLKIKVVDPYKPTKVELDVSGTIILGVGEELQLDAALYPETAESVLEWDSSSSRCKVDEDGLVTAVRTGSATITVETENGKKDSVKIQVVKADEPYSVSLNEEDTIFLAAGEEYQLEAEILPATADAELKWSSSSSRCEVDEDGLVTALRVGSATITVRTENGKKDSVKIKVY